MIVLQIVYLASVILLAVMGFNALLLSLIYLATRKRTASAQPLNEDQWPEVVVQLPIYNERHVVDTLIESISHLDYPYDRLTVQVLDDSTDETTARIVAAVDVLARRGFPIVHIRRQSREGYKAGALKAGLSHTGAEFVTVFDADFAPQSDFLRRVIPHFLADPRLGMAQTRWAHLNEPFNLLTRIQALVLDAHFVIEQTARNRGGLLMNFSGTAGIWRRACIEDSGGWQGDTLSEDIDLSYRAQLGGWRCLYLPDVEAPAEIPPLMMAYKRQQSRWATGTIQCLRKLGGKLLTSDLNAWQKLESIIHLGGYFIHPLMLVVLLLTLPLILTGSLQQHSLTWLGVGFLIAPIQMMIAQKQLHPDWLRRMSVFPLLMLLGIGIAVSNTYAIIGGFTKQPVHFARTPKFHAERQTGISWMNTSYGLPVDRTTWLEIGFAVYAAITALVSWWYSPAVTPFMALYAVGFAYVAGVSLWEARAVRQHLPSGKHSWRLLENSGD